MRADFFERVEVGAPDECWRWKLSVGSHGYGQWWPRRGSADPTFDRNWLTHRLSWFLHRGPIPPRWTIDHRCRNRRCCNPAHLRLTTNVDNATDNGMGRRTHCPQGHPYDGPNLYRAPRGDRRCRTCMTQQNERRDRRKVRF